jgi:hypothetical protein
MHRDEVFETSELKLSVKGLCAARVPEFSSWFTGNV